MKIKCKFGRDLKIELIERINKKCLGIFEMRHEYVVDVWCWVHSKNHTKLLRKCIKLRLGSDLFTKKLNETLTFLGLNNLLINNLKSFEMKLC